MKSVTKRIYFAFLSIWHCAVSFVSPWWLVFTFACFADVNNDEYAASFIVGAFLLTLWLLCFLPSFISLTVTLKRVKKILAYIPLAAFVLFAMIGIAVVGFPSLSEILSDIFGGMGM